MILTRILRILPGVTTAFMAVVTFLAILGTILVPCDCDMSKFSNSARRVVMAVAFAAGTLFFGRMAQWCFTGRGLKFLER